MDPTITIFLAGLACLVGAIISTVLAWCPRGWNVGIALSIAARLFWAACFIVVPTLDEPEKLVLLATWGTLEVLVFVMSPRPTINGPRPVNSRCPA